MSQLIEGMITPKKKLTWQWKLRLKMYFSLNLGIFHCHVSFPECNINNKLKSRGEVSKIPSRKYLSYVLVLPLSCAQLKLVACCGPERIFSRQLGLHVFLYKCLEAKNLYPIIPPHCTDCTIEIPIIEYTVMILNCSRGSYASLN